jgi:hypothetical protein
MCGKGNRLFPKSVRAPMIRYAGLFSSRWKKQYLGKARIALNQPDPDYYDKIKGFFVKKLKYKSL